MGGHNQFNPVANAGETCLNLRVKLTARPCELQLANPWKIASSKSANGSGTHRTVIVELTDADGVNAIGEAAPSSLYGESADGLLKFLRSARAEKISFTDIPGSMAYLTAAGNSRRRQMRAEPGIARWRGQARGPAAP